MFIHFNAHVPVCCSTLRVVVRGPGSSHCLPPLNAALLFSPAALTLAGACVWERPLRGCRRPPRQVALVDLAAREGSTLSFDRSRSTYRPRSLAHRLNPIAPHVNLRRQLIKAPAPASRAPARARSCRSYSSARMGTPGDTSPALPIAVTMRRDTTLATAKLPDLELPNDTGRSARFDRTSAAGGARCTRLAAPGRSRLH